MHMRLDAGEWIAVWAPAKLNLYLEIIAKRDDGFHEIETLMCPITLCDTLYLRPRTGSQSRSGAGGASNAEHDHAAGDDIRIDWSWAGPRHTAGAAPRPAERENSVYRALRLLQQRAGIGAGADVRLIKRIPAAAGLAGGSSDAAAALAAANRAWGLHWPTARLAALAAELGSDVPFFFAGGPAFGRARGEQIEPVALRSVLHFVVVCPPQGLLTSDVYRRCAPQRAPGGSAPLIAGIRALRYDQIQRGMFNGLQAAARTLTPWIDRLQEEFSRSDVVGHQMSGSGSSYFAVCRNARQARRLGARLRTRNVGNVYVVRSYP
jgi:4-diphosphocytidyl-2-C-methyl-D-erythritol kinase